MATAGMTLVAGPKLGSVNVPSPRARGIDWAEGIRFSFGTGTVGVNAAGIVLQIVRIPGWSGDDGVPGTDGGGISADFPGPPHSLNPVGSLTASLAGRFFLSGWGADGTASIGYTGTDLATGLTGADKASAYVLDLILKGGPGGG